MNADGSGQINLTSNGRFDLQPAWSPDGQKIAFTSVGEGDVRIYVMNADGSAPTRLASNFARQPAWSPDGQKIAFASPRDGGGIYVMNADGSAQTRLTSNLAGQPAWSPDGQKIAFASGGLGSGDVYVMNADGSGQTNLTSNGRFDGEPAWSPDGQKIAFRSDRDDANAVYVMNADGSGQTRITNNTASDGDPAWSPDGEQIAFSSTRDGNTEIYVMNADGSGQTRLTNDAAFDGEPDWQPVPSADLALSLAATPDVVRNAQQLTYTITVRNAGPSKAHGVVVTDSLPAQARFVSATPAQGGSCDSPLPGATGTLICRLGTLGASTQTANRITVKVVAKKTTILNTASVTSATSDPVAANNAATIATRVK